MDWVSLALTIVKLGTALFKHFERQAQQRIGEDREKLKQFSAMQEISDKLKEIDERFDRMTDDEVKKEIEAQGDFRD